MPEIALFGTWNGSTWRDYVKTAIEDAGIQADVYDPVLPEGEEWTKEHRRIENDHKFGCDVLVITITPRMSGVYAIAEAVETFMTPELREKVVLCVIDEDGDARFDEKQLDSLEAFCELAERHEVQVADELDDLIPIFRERLKVVDKVARGLPAQDYVFNPNVIQCCIQRDGPTTMVLYGRKYVFARNDRGHYVAFIPSESAISTLLKDQQSYRRYCPEDCVVTPEQKHRYGIAMDKTEHDSFWKDFVQSFIRLPHQDFCGRQEIIKAPEPPRKNYHRPPDKMRFIDGFIQSNVETINSAPDWVREKAREKWVRGCKAMGVSWAYPGR